MAAAGSQASISKGWISWPRYRLWNTAPAESGAKEACKNTASSCAAPTIISTAGTAAPAGGSPHDYCTAQQADVHTKSGTLSSSEGQKGGSQGQRHDYSLSSSFTSANCSGSTDIVDTSSINWLYGGSFPRGRTLSFELDEQRLQNSPRAPEVTMSQPLHNSQYPTQINLLDGAATSSACSSDNQPCVPGTLQEVDNHLHHAQNATPPQQGDQQETPSDGCTNAVPTARQPTSFSFEPSTLHQTAPASPFAMVAQRKSQSFGALPAQSVAPGQGITINNRPLIRSATGSFQPIMSLQDQQQFLQNEWLLLQQQTQIQKQQLGSSSRSQQLGRACEYSPLQSQLSLAEDSNIIDTDAVRLDLQEDGVRSRRGGRTVTAGQVGLEDEKRGMGMDNDRWVARRRFVLDSVWAAEGSE